MNKVLRYFDIVIDCNKKLNYVDFFDHDEIALMNVTDHADVVEPHASANVRSGGILCDCLCHVVIVLCFRAPREPCPVC